MEIDGIELNAGAVDRLVDVIGHNPRSACRRLTELVESSPFCEREQRELRGES